jgi:hypothetical protein
LLDNIDNDNNESSTSTHHQIDANERKNLEELHKTIMRQQCRKIKTAIEERNMQIQSLQKQMNETIQVLRMERTTLSCLNNVNADYAIQQLQTTINKGWYQWHGIVGDSIWLTTPEINMINVSDPHNSGNVGSFVVELDKDGSCRVWPLKNNFDADAFHPFIYRGEVCFGNSTAEAKQFLTENKFDEFFDLLQLILTIYNSNAPHASLPDLFNQKRLDSPLYHSIVTNRLAYNSQWNQQIWPPTLKKS